MDTVQPEKSELVERIKNLDIDALSPREALEFLYEMKKLSDDIE